MGRLQDEAASTCSICLLERETLEKEQTEKLNVEVPAVEAADTRLLFSECGGSFWIKFSFCTVGVEGAWPDEAQTRFRVME